MALHYGAMLRECIRHQSVARWVKSRSHSIIFQKWNQIACISEINFLLFHGKREYDYLGLESPFPWGISKLERVHVNWSLDKQVNTLLEVEIALTDVNISIILMDSNHDCSHGHAHDCSCCCVWPKLSCHVCI